MFQAQWIGIILQEQPEIFTEIYFFATLQKHK